MDQVPQWLAAAVNAAGMTTVYNAEDWQRATEPSTRDPEELDPPVFPH